MSDDSSAMLVKQFNGCATDSARGSGDDGYASCQRQCLLVHGDESFQRWYRSVVAMPIQQHRGEGSMLRLPDFASARRFAVTDGDLRSNAG
jgi:hypothetical protein